MRGCGWKVAGRSGSWYECEARFHASTPTQPATFAHLPKRRSSGALQERKRDATRQPEPLAAEQPAKEREGEADEDASDDWERKRGVAFLDEDVAGEATQSTETASLPQDRAGNRQDQADDEEEFAKVMHSKTVSEPRAAGNTHRPP